MDASGSATGNNHESPNQTASHVESESLGSEWVDEEDDDDMDFEPTADSTDQDADFLDPSEDAEAEFQDAEDGLAGVDIDFSFAVEEDDLQQSAAVDATETDDRLPHPAHTTGARFHVSHDQLMQLLGHAGLQRLYTNHNTTHTGPFSPDDEEDVDLDDGYGVFGARRRRRPRGAKTKPPPIPSEEGRKLMDSGSFGISTPYQNRPRMKTRLAGSLMGRELGINGVNSVATNKLLSHDLIPSSNADTIIHYDRRCYSGQFSDDGNFFFCCGQDFKVRMYDTSNPYKWKYYKTVVYPYGQWTITDASLSPDNKYLAYSSIRSVGCLAPTDPSESGDPLLLDFSDMGQRNSRRRFNGGYPHFGIWSIRFSGDGRELVGGTSDHSVYVHDIETRKSTLRIPGHNDDVNAVCFGDASSPHILYSGSDDTLIKVWDRRSMGDSREAGVFVGHTEGLTYVDSKGDGRYVLSNSKDQTMKLWDLRKMMPTDKASKLDPARYTTGFDYRYMAYPQKDYYAHPHDCSIVTFRGHRVLKTLIRCHFSPPGSTDSRFVCSGSEDGKVHIYNLDATLAGKIDVAQATYQSRPRDPHLCLNTYDHSDRSGVNWKTCVRDVSWHPHAPVIAATSWNGWGMSMGTCTIHTWNDGSKDDEAGSGMGTRVDEQLQRNEDRFENSRLRTGRTSVFRARLRSERVAARGEDVDEEAQ